jgi:hypothetical protein
MEENGGLKTTTIGTTKTSASREDDDKTREEIGGLKE